MTGLLRHLFGSFPRRTPLQAIQSYAATPPDSPTFVFAICRSLAQSCEGADTVSFSSSVSSPYYCDANYGQLATQSARMIESPVIGISLVYTTNITCPSSPSMTSTTFNIKC